MTNPTRPLENRVAEMRARIAAEHSAMHLAQLSLARWRTAAPATSAGASTMPASQARWHAQAQQHFHAWLAEGGFARTGASAGGAGTALKNCQHEQE